MFSKIVVVFSVRSDATHWTRRGCTQNSLTSACAQHTSSWGQHCALRGQRSRCVACEKSAHLHGHPSNLAMSLLNITFVPFPQLHSPSSASPSRSTTTAPSCTGSRRTPTNAHSAFREETGRLANSTPRTGYEPNLTDLFAYTNRSDHPGFLCSDNLTVIPPSPEGVPCSEASSTAASSAPIFGGWEDHFGELTSIGLQRRFLAQCQ